MLVCHCCRACSTTQSAKVNPRRPMRPSERCCAPSLPTYASFLSAVCVLCLVLFACVSPPTCRAEKFAAVWAQLAFCVSASLRNNTSLVWTLSGLQYVVVFAVVLRKLYPLKSTQSHYIFLMWFNVLWRVAISMSRPPNRKIFLQKPENRENL